MYPSHPSKVSFASLMIFSLLASLFTPLRQKNVQLARAASASSVTVEARIASGGDDVEQRLSDGFIYKDSSDLELINDPGVVKGPQSVGMRFTDLSIPQGATITRAYLTFHVDETSSEATSLTLRAQAADNAGGFSFKAYNVTSRPHTNASVSWDNLPSWNSVGASVQSPDLAPVIQEVVNRTGWASGNSLVLFVDGSGRRVAVSYEGSASKAPQLHVEYTTSQSASPTPTNIPTIAPTATQPPPTPTQAPTNAPTATQPTPIPTQAPTNAPTPTSIPPTLTRVPTTTPTSKPGTGSTTIEARIASGGDDVEQRLSDGFIYKDSSDLELINDPGVVKGPQSVGMRFTDLSIPQGATITRSYLTFHVDETSSEATSLTLRAQAADNAAGFSFNAYDVTSRPHTNASTSWGNLPAWNSVGASVQSPDLAPVIQEVVSRNGWASGNSLVLFVDGLGRRVAVSYEGSASTAPQLHVEYTTSQSAPPTATKVPTATPPAVTFTPAPTNAPTATAIPPTPAPTASPTPGGDPQPIGQSGSWKMVFRDEFNSNSLDQSKWHTCFWWADTTCSIETNHELELYNPGDVLVQNGVLQLRAQKRDMTAWNGSTYHYTSGMVMTGGRSGSIAPGFTFTYGYAEARVKVPAGKGLWPAFWMLPVSYNSRPEIDIMEILGHQPNVYHMNYHYIGGDQGTSWTGPDFSAGWHVIGLDWDADAIVWYVDGVERYRFTNKTNISNEPEYLLLNLAVGGVWPGSPDSNTPFPSTFDVDYVRVWQK